MLQECQALRGAGVSGSGSVCPHDQPPYPSGGRAPRHLHAPIWQCLLQAARLPSTPGTGSAPATGKAPGTEVSGDRVLRLEEGHELASPLVRLGRRDDDAELREARLQVRPGLIVPQARLANPPGQNLCYANACFQAWCWIGQLAGTVGRIGGSFEAGLHLVHRAGSLHLSSCMAWFFDPHSATGDMFFVSMMQVSFGSIF